MERVYKKHMDVEYVLKKYWENGYKPIVWSQDKMTDIFSRHEMFLFCYHMCLYGYWYNILYLLGTHVYKGLIKIFLLWNHLKCPRNSFMSGSYWAHRKSEFMQVMSQHIEAWTKWPPFCRRYFQLHFLERNFSYFGSNFTDVCSIGSDWPYVTIGLGNGLSPSRRQAIALINGDPVHWHGYASSDLNG